MFGLTDDASCTTGSSASQPAPGQTRRIAARSARYRDPLAAWRRGGDDLGKRISLLVYGTCLIGCYAASTLYHGVRLPPDRLGIFIRLDSVGIFALIAGTYTPLAWVLMRGRWRAWTLATVWGIALASIALIASGRRFSPVAGTGVYLAMGWGVLICYARMAQVVSHRALLPIALGGVSYSVGAVLNLLGRPIVTAGQKT